LHSIMLQIDFQNHRFESRNQHFLFIPFNDIDIIAAGFDNRFNPTKKFFSCRINFGSDLLYPSLTHAAHMVADYFKSEEQKEGPAAFLEKRKPNFRKFRK